VPRCEVMVIGGGPAGSTIAALLAGKGRDVVLLERDRHPRFHIGESLLPLNLPLFERLGVAREIERIAMPKYGAEFVSPWHERPVTFEFADAWDKGFPKAFQVRRSQFDEILFRNAVRRGARAFEECRATAVDFRAEGPRVAVRHADGTDQSWDASFLVDASGRETFLANRFGMKRRSRKHNSAAIFGHFAGAERLAGRAEGNITVFWFAHGWLWFIPLADGITSVGAVCWPYYLKTRKNPPHEFLLDTIALCPPLASRLRNARLVSDVSATGNYSYCADRSAGDRYLLLGDAYTFIDPVFSTGVFLAMHGAFVGAETVEACLDEPRHAKRLLKTFSAHMRHAPRVFSWLIYRVTSPTMRDLFMEPSNQWRIKEALLALLAGDVYRGMPFRWRLLLFKAIYYLHNVMRPRRTWHAWIKRRRSIQAV
jgi:flavin-dependent dehydrogenase